MKTAAIAICLWFTTAGMAVAQSATLYSECFYGGQQVTLGVGRYYLYQMQIPNDRLRSVQIPQGMQVTIYEHDAFQGRSRVLTSSNNCLEMDWKDMASSVEVAWAGGAQTGGQDDYVTCYADCYQRGANITLRPGRYTSAGLGSMAYNLSSFIIKGNVRVKLYLNSDNFQGTPKSYESSVYCLLQSQNDKTGSIEVEYLGGGGTGGGVQGGDRYAAFYSACNYEGNALRLMPGTYNGAKLGVLKGSIASVQVGSGLRVKAYTSSENLFGSYTDITADMSCLDAQLLNRIQSLVVEDVYGGGGGNPGPPEPVVIYADGSYRGQQASLLPGRYSTMAAAGNFPDNALSSLQVPPGYRVVLYELENFGGKSLTVTSSRSSFFLQNWWNDKTSSIIVYKDR